MSSPNEFGGGDLPGKKSKSNLPLNKQQFHGSKKPQQPGNDIVVTTAFELIGISALTLLAGVNRQLGSIVVIIMVGFLLGWLLIHTAKLQGWLKKV
jgi:hypothetical protein